MTNTAEMPVEIWVDECYWYPAELVAKEQGEYRDNKLATYTRTDTIPDVAELQRQNAVLKAAFRKLFDEASWTVYGTIMNEAAAGGIVIPHSVTQEDIDDVRFDNSECALGDTVYVMSDWMQNAAAKIPIPSRAAVAREFLRVVKNRQKKLKRKFPSLTQGAARLNAKNEILKEWEDA